MNALLSLPLVVLSTTLQRRDFEGLPPGLLVELSDGRALAVEGDWADYHRNWKLIPVGTVADEGAVDVVPETILAADELEKVRAEHWAACSEWYASRGGGQ